MELFLLFLLAVSLWFFCGICTAWMEMETARKHYLSAKHLQWTPLSDIKLLDDDYIRMLSKEWPFDILFGCISLVAFLYYRCWKGRMWPTIYYSYGRD